ncbi:MAG: proline--tRNA ligase [Chloroflexi bacterium]|nr:proline--tRNA ligase [Chloroflexota bacterium]MYB85352.1 proline--tRNA ligase [Chloroflexota bacterium]
MRATEFLSRTLRQDPSEAETASHRLMLRAGMMLQAAAGVYSYLPLALRSIRKIERIVREEMNAAGGQEVLMPALQTLETWEESGRAAAFGGNLFRLFDRRERPMVLAPTHEEVVTAIAGVHVESYRDLPLNIYQIQTKFRDEPRPRAGLLRGREFVMKDAYSFDTDQEGLDVTYQRMRVAYRNIFRRCGLPTIEVEADSGAIGGKDSHEFIMPAPSGEDVILYCEESGYAANVERATSVIAPAAEDEPRPLELVDTPGITTITDLAVYLGITESQTLKAVFYQADDETLLVTIRGDIEVNEVKLKNHLHCIDLRLANAEEVAAAGLTPGSTSPIGLSGIRRIADNSIMQGTNFAAGANQPDKHYQNVNYPRDFQIDETVDIATAREGDGSPDNQGTLKAVRGIEVGHVFKLGTFFTTTLGVDYLDENGTLKPPVMGCYGIGVTRVLAAAIEQNHDDKGIIFPAPIAPFQAHLLALNASDLDVIASADALYGELTSAGCEVLYDDRAESAGVKFNDADLLGLPVRIVVSPRNLKQGVVEIKRRRVDEAAQVPADGVVAAVRELLALDEL